MSSNIIYRKALAVDFTKFERWDVKFFCTILKSKYPLVRLKPFIKEHNEKVHIANKPEDSYNILGVNNKNGIFLAYEALGKDINQPYKKVDADDFAYNPYRVNVGSIGMVPEDLAGNYISPAYVVFSVDETKIIPKVLELILKSRWFNPRLRAATAGSVRQNLTYELLGTLEVPFPPMDIQNKILEEWYKAQERTNRIYERIKKIKTEIDLQFFNGLGLELPDTFKYRKAFSIMWDDFQRWSVSYNQAIANASDLSIGKFPLSEIGSLLDFVQYGTSEKANSDNAGTPIIRMNNIIEGLLDLSDLKYIKLSKSEEKRLLLKEGDILFNRTNSKELVGKCAVFREDGNYVFASYLIRLRVNEKALPDYLEYSINCPLGKQQINALSRQIIGQANINTDELRSLRVPLPPIGYQEKLIKIVSDGRERIFKENEKINFVETETDQIVESLSLGL